MFKLFNYEMVRTGNLPKNIFVVKSYLRNFS